MKLSIENYVILYITCICIYINIPGDVFENKKKRIL